LYSYREFIDLQSDGLLSQEEKLAKRNLTVMRQCVENKGKLNEALKASKKD